MTASPFVKPINRRSFLSLAALTAGVSACGVPDSGTGGGGEGGSLGTLKAATYFPPSYNDLFPQVELFLDTAEKESGGDLKFQMFHSGTLLDAEQLVPGMMQGVADIVFQTSSYVSSTYPVLGVYELPFVHEGGVEQTQRALEVEGDLYNLINDELGKKGLHCVASMPTSLEWIWTVEKPILKPDDLRGMRIRTAGNVEGETVKAFGGSPVSMSSSEVYQALERGTIDGMVSYIGTVISRELQEIIRYGTRGHFGDYSVDAYVRKNWYDDLDDTVREALLTAGRTYLDEGTTNQLKVHEEEYLPQIEEAGIEITDPQGEELAAFKDAAKAVETWWRGRVGDEAKADEALDLLRNA